MRRLLSLSLLLLLPLLVQAQNVTWYISPGRSLAFIKPACSEEDLLRDYGSWNVERTTIPLDGASVPATVLFPHDDAKRVVLLWHDDAARRQLKAAILRGNHSFWRLPGNVTLGTPYRKLVETNARPVGVSAFGEQGGVQVSDWQNGQFARFDRFLDVRLDGYPAAPVNGKSRPLTHNTINEIRVFFPEPK
ncbi:hypothetical protein [Microvirgula aerodenitrificans]|uniref:hypothetical protein n=1 Tax=Microvirgula aerodenitrificans TaxID=57480 RepID=UPI0028E5934B|nr:hypothetical protein [Microvirgula aerodenitrificans]